MASTDSNAERDIRPGFMAGIYGLSSLGLIVTAYTVRVLGRQASLIAFFSHHPRLVTITLAVGIIVFMAQGTYAIDLKPAAAGVSYVVSCVSVGFAFAMLAKSGVHNLFAPLLVSAGAYAVLAAFVGATRLDLDDLAPAAFLAVAGMLISFLVGVMWEGDYMTFLVMVVVTLIAAVLAAFSSAFVRSMVLARSPERPPVCTLAGAIVFLLAVIMYVGQVIPTQYGYQYKNNP